MSLSAEEPQAITPVTTQVDQLPAAAPPIIAPVPRLRTRTEARKAWAEAVGWDGDFRALDDDAYKDSSEVKKLKELIKARFIVPKWLADINSPKYAYFNGMECFREGARILARRVAKSEYEKIDNEKLSTDVEECLPSILQILRHVQNLKAKSSLLAVEADRRHPVDMLGSLVWDLQSEGRVFYRAEHRLQIPHTTQKNITYVVPDACAFVPISDTIADSIPPPLRPGLTCFSSTETGPPNYGYILHWVTEFKGGSQVAKSRHQVVEGLVAALYQRRAFGFPNHLIFGTAHHSYTTLEVLAATWVRSEPTDAATGSTQGASAKSTALAVGQASIPSGSGSRGVDATGHESKANEGTENAILTIEEIKKYNKIVVYTIAEFSMDYIPHLLELYLIMRHTWILVQEYQNDVQKHSVTLIRKLATQAKDNYTWAPQPRPSKRRRTGSDTSRYMPSVTEGQNEEADDHEYEEDNEDGMSVDPDDSSDSASDPQELDSLSSPGPTHIISGEVAKYTMMNYAYERDTGAREAGDSRVPTPPISQTA
ncbi:unnamed protein product [Rhizoctonia solani]|uniref:Uncharacterized protein n=1 Tax=Rhizoctonia solani TaxID=456999 RepID=A0A8H3E2R2_9AGAM|nr:unnamed protein product [Rhizoctonia solani]